MTNNKIVKNVKDKNLTNKIVFAVLSFLIAGLLIFNFVRISTAYFTDQKTSNFPIITTGNVAIAYNLYDSNGISVATSSPLYVGDNQLVPGTEISYTFEVQNQGTRDCYLRIKLDFLIKSGSDWDLDTTGNVTIASNDSETTTFLRAADGYLYYKLNSGVTVTKTFSRFPLIELITV